MFDKSMEMDMRAYSGSLSEVQDELEKISGLVKAIPLVADDESTVGMIVGKIKTKIDDIGVRVSQCRSGLEVLATEIGEKTDLKKTTFDVKYVDGRQENCLYAPSIDELKKVCEANGDKIEEAVERDGFGAVVKVHRFPQNCEGSTLTEFWNMLPNSLKNKIGDTSKQPNLERLLTLWMSVGFPSDGNDDANS